MEDNYITLCIHCVCTLHTTYCMCSHVYNVPGEAAAGAAGVEGREEVRGLLGPAPDGDPMGRYLEGEEEEEEEVEMTSAFTGRGRGRERRMEREREGERGREELTVWSGF